MHPRNTPDDEAVNVFRKQSVFRHTETSFVFVSEMFDLCVTLVVTLLQGCVTLHHALFSRPLPVLRKFVHACMEGEFVGDRGRGVSLHDCLGLFFCVSY